MRGLVMMSLSVALAAAPGSAQVAAPDGDDAAAVVVTGRRASAESRARAAARFVRRTGVAAGDRQTARWVDPVCVRILNLEPSFAQLVADRLQATAVAAQVPIAGPGCRPNIVISFTEDGPALARTVARRSPRSLSEVPLLSRKRVIEGAAPVRWWYSTEVKGSDGRDLASGPSPAETSGGEGGTSLLSGPRIDAYTSSLVATYGIRVLKSATVIVDIGKAAGLPLAAVADYAIFVALAEIKPADPPPVGSILSLFAAGATDRRLSEQDRSLLTVLYAMPLNRTARRQRGMLAHGIVGAAR